MSAPLAVDDYRWFSMEASQSLNVSQISDNSEMGYWLEGYLDFDSTLHDLHSDYPFCAEHQAIAKNYVLLNLDCFGKTLEGIQKTRIPNGKLVETLNDTKCYVLHYNYTYLQMCLKKKS